MSLPAIRHTVKRPRPASRRRLAAPIVPSGKAMAAATSRRSGVSGPTASGRSLAIRHLRRDDADRSDCGRIGQLQQHRRVAGDGLAMRINERAPAGEVLAA